MRDLEGVIEGFSVGLFLVFVGGLIGWLNPEPLFVDFTEVTVYGIGGFGLLTTAMYLFGAIWGQVQNSSFNTMKDWILVLTFVLPVILMFLSFSGEFLKYFQGDAVRLVTLLLTTGVYGRMILGR